MESPESLRSLIEVALICAARVPVPPGGPIGLLTGGPAVTIKFALRANLEILPVSHDLAANVAAVPVSNRRDLTHLKECGGTKAST